MKKIRTLFSKPAFLKLHITVFPILKYLNLCAKRLTNRILDAIFPMKKCFFRMGHMWIIGKKAEAYRI